MRGQLPTAPKKTVTFLKIYASSLQKAIITSLLCFLAKFFVTSALEVDSNLLDPLKKRSKHPRVIQDGYAYQVTIKTGGAYKLCTCQTIISYNPPHLVALIIIGHTGVTTGTGMGGNCEVGPFNETELNGLHALLP